MILGAKTSNLPPLVRGKTVLFRVEILGVVPNGLTHNDVFATINSVIRDESPKVQSVTKRRLANNYVSVIMAYEATDMAHATRLAEYAQSSVMNFSADLIGPYVQR